MNSRAKGCRGERALRDLLRAEGYEARRGKQYSGDESAPDVICPSLPDIHWEAKWCENTHLHDWIAQAERDCGHKMPIVVHKRNHGKPIASMPFSVLADIIRRSDLPDQEKRDTGHSSAHLDCFGPTDGRGKVTKDTF